MAEDNVGLDGMKVVLVSPTYGHVDPLCSKDLRQAIMFASNHGLKWYGDASPDRLGYGAARNKAVEESVIAESLRGGENADGIMWVDSDIRMENHCIAKLLETVRRLELDFVTGVYHQRDGYHNPVIYSTAWDKKKNKRTFSIGDTYPEKTVSRIGGCGFGFVYTSTKMLIDMSRLKTFTEKGKWFPDKRNVGGYGEDLAFCDLAIQAGYELQVDTGVQVGHTGEPKVIYRKDFLEKSAEYQVYKAKLLSEADDNL